MQGQRARNALDLQKILNSVKTSAGLEGQSEAGLSLSVGQCWMGVSCAPSGAGPWQVREPRLGMACQAK